MWSVSLHDYHNICTTFPQLSSVGGQTLHVYQLLNGHTILANKLYRDISTIYHLEIKQHTRNGMPKIKKVYIC